ncbi:MAG: hypothetical protein WKF48_01565 [Solirubrobacteraceae bacterium]
MLMGPSRVERHVARASSGKLVVALGGEHTISAGVSRDLTARAPHDRHRRPRSGRRAATGTPEPDGLSWHEALDVIRTT